MSTLDFSILDIPAEVERHTRTRLHPTSRSGKQFSGACPYDDCSVDTDGFTVWRDLTDRGRHYYCRGCRRSGDIVKLLRDIRGYTFKQALETLGLANPYEQSASTCATSTRAPTKVRGPLAPADWQVRERNILQGIYPNARRALQRPRARAYLAQRGIPFDLAQELGLGYIPPFSDIPPDKITDDLRAIRPWCDRIIFPLTSSAGQGFTGRALFLWEEGMDENEHKKRIDAYNARMVEEHGEKDAARYQVSRWKTTYPAGYFHAEVLQTCDRVTFVEGPFDALALLAGGILDALATCGTSLEASAIPVRICDATLAYDGDEKGKKASADLYKILRRKGITPRVVIPSIDDGRGKDWSERYRRSGMIGLQLLLNSPAPQNNMRHPGDTLSSDTGCTDEDALMWATLEIEDPLCFDCLNEEGIDTVALPEDIDGLMYCEKHWHEHQAERPTSSVCLDSFMAAVQRMAAVLGPGCTISEPMRCTPQEYIARRQAEDEQARKRDRQPEAPRKPERIPVWLIPGSKEWNDHIDFLALGPKDLRDDMKRLGLRPQMTREEALAEMNERRAAWFAMATERN